MPWLYTSNQRPEKTNAQVWNCSSGACAASCVSSAPGLCLESIPACSSSPLDEEILGPSTGGSNKLENVCRMTMQLFLLFCPGGWSKVMFQLSGCYCVRRDSYCKGDWPKACLFFLRELMTLSELQPVARSGFTGSVLGSHPYMGFVLMLRTRAPTQIAGQVPSQIQPMLEARILANSPCGSDPVIMFCSQQY